MATAVNDPSGASGLDGRRSAANVGGVSGWGRLGSVSPKSRISGETTYIGRGKYPLRYRAVPIVVMLLFSMTAYAQGAEQSAQNQCNLLGIGKDVSTILGVLIALFAFGKGILEYTLKNKLDRFTKFQEIRTRMKGNEEFREILALAEVDDERLKFIDFAIKRDLLGLFEEVALMVSSGILKREVAHYMFGYYAIRLYDSENFWLNVNKNSYYWSVFRRFTEDMRKIEDEVLSGKRQSVQATF
jgi:hypothetical protein